MNRRKDRRAQQKPERARQADSMAKGRQEKERGAFFFDLPLPQTIALAVQGRWSTAHPGLAFNKYINTWKSSEKERKREFFLSFCKTYGKYPDPGLLAQFNERRQKFLKTLKAEGYCVQDLKLTTHWRLVSGLGIPHPFETGFIFDHTYGVPYLPGSSVKGVARAWAKEVNGWEPDVRQAVFGPKEEDSKEMGREFQPAQGGVIFFDAYPIIWPKLEVDILNVHYKEYYEGDKPPADWLSPVPIYFLTVAPGQTFQFAVAVKPGVPEFIRKGAEVSDAEQLAKKAMEAIVGATRDLGLGGKTAVAYGYFQQEKETKR